MLDKVRGDDCYCKWSQTPTPTKLCLFYQNSRLVSRAEGCNKSQASRLFCLRYLILRVVRRTGEPFPSGVLASTTFVFAVSVRFRGDIIDVSSESSTLRFLLAGIELFVLLASGGDVTDRSSESSALRLLLVGIELFVMSANPCLHD